MKNPLGLSLSTNTRRILEAAASDPAFDVDNANDLADYHGRDPAGV